jgi:hypothetical protein
MHKKFLFIGMAAILGASLVFFACDSDAGTETKYVDKETPIHVDETASTEQGLKGFLMAEEDLVIGIPGSIQLSADLTIPKGKVIYILNGGSLDVDGHKLTVEGVIYVGVGATLETYDSAGTGKVSVTDGIVHVTKGGILSMKDEKSVDNGEATPDTVLKNKNKVSIEEGAKLKVNTLATLDKVKEFFDTYLTSGTLEITNLTTTAVAPSAVVSTITTITATKGLSIGTMLTGAETAPSLIIPAGLGIITSANLDTVTDLTVNGSLWAASATGKPDGVKIVVGDDAHATLGTVAKLTGNSVLNGTLAAAAITAFDAAAALAIEDGGALTLTGAIGTLTAGATVTVKNGGTLTGVITSFDTTNTLAVEAGATVNGVTFPGATAVSALAATGTMTIGDLMVGAGKTFTIPASMVVTVSAGKTLAVGDTLAFTDNTSQLFILAGGKITATADSEFHAKLGQSPVIDGSGITLTVYNPDTDLTTATGFTSDDPAAGSPVTLTTGSAASGSGSAYVIGNASFTVKNITAVTNGTPIVSTAAGSSAVGGIIADSDTATAFSLEGKS